MNTAANKLINFSVEEGKKYRLWIWRVERVFDKYRRWQLRRRSTPNKYYLPHDPVTLKISDLKGIMVDSTTAYNYSESTENGDIYYISDKLEKDKITRRIGQVVLDGSETITKKETDNSELACYCLDFSRYFKNDRSFDHGLCNYFKRLTSYEGDSQGIAFGMGDKNLYLFLNKVDFPDVDAVSAWLKEKYEDSKPVTIFYILDEATEELLELESALKSFPKFTRILVSESEGAASLGMAKCIKTQIL